MEPADLGISAGLNEYGKESYVGRGTFNGQLAPGKLMIDGAGVPYQPALYFEWDNFEHVLTEGVEYYAKESRCNYKWVPSSNGQKVSNAVGFRSEPYTFYVGRTTTFSSTQVGKVTLEHNTMYYAYGGKGYSVNNYEVLVCDEETKDQLRETIRKLKEQLKACEDSNATITFQ